MVAKQDFLSWDEMMIEDQDSFEWNKEATAFIKEILAKAFDSKNVPQDVAYTAESLLALDAELYDIVCTFTTKQGDEVSLRYTFDSGAGGLPEPIEVDGGYTFKFPEPHPSYSNVELSKTLANSKKVYHYSFSKHVWMLKTAD